MKKKELEIILQKIPAQKIPKASLEQYSTPASIASDILFTAFFLNDIKDKVVIDLGCGTGIFAIGAKLLGAKKVIGVDIDQNAVKIAREFAKDLKLDIEIIIEDINKFSSKAQTVFQNPPFGSQNKHADRKFLKKAINTAPVIYTIHLLKTTPFIENFFGNDARITLTKNYKFPIKHTFSFHTKEYMEFNVTLFRIERIVENQNERKT